MNWYLPTIAAIIAALVLAWVFLGAGRAFAQEAPLRDVVIHVKVPPATETVYMPGNVPQLGPWDAGKFAMTGDGELRTARLQVPDGTALEFKFTLGSWDREGLGPSGTVMGNFELLVDGDKEETYEIIDFKKDPAEYIADWKGSGVIGRLDYWLDVESEHLGPSRHVEIWTPPGYEDDPERRYPVLYMHDGQNLFDPRIANTGVDWGVDESIMRLVEAGKIEPPIVVGIWCTDDRRAEYSPWHNGPAYARFIIEELMPRVNAEYRTLTGPENTGTMGSSMGGLISFYLCQSHPDVFGRGGCVSTHWPWNGLGLPPTSVTPAFIDAELDKGFSFPAGLRMYFDYGTMGIDAMYEPYQERVTKLLKEQGYVEGENLKVEKFPGADHNEANWRKRLDTPMEFLWAE